MKMAKMTWKEIEQDLDNGKRQIVFVTKQEHHSFQVYNYSINSTVNTMLSLFDIWGNGASCSFLYKEKFGVEGYEIFNEMYDFFRSYSMRIAFKRLGVEIIFEDDLESM